MRTIKVREDDLPVWAVVPDGAQRYDSVLEVDDATYRRWLRAQEAFEEMQTEIIEERHRKGMG